MQRTAAPEALHYEISHQDIYAMAKARAGGLFAKVGRAVLFMLWFANVLIGGFAAYLQFFKGADMGFALLFSASIIALMPAYHFLIEPWFFKLYYKKLNLEGKKLMLRANEEGIFSSTANFSSTINWPEFIRTSRTETHFFFWINKVQAMIVPFRAFTSEKQRDLFWDYAQEKLGKAAKSAGEPS